MKMEKELWHFGVAACEAVKSDSSPDTCSASAASTASTVLVDFHMSSCCWDR